MDGSQVRSRQRQSKEGWDSSDGRSHRLAGQTRPLNVSGSGGHEGCPQAEDRFGLRRTWQQTRQATAQYTAVRIRVFVTR